MSVPFGLWLLILCLYLCCAGNRCSCDDDWQPSRYTSPPYRFDWRLTPGDWSRLRRGLLVIAVWSGIIWGLVPLARLFGYG
jgi:hypothetical protein